jgi:dTMP kinase
LLTIVIAKHLSLLANNGDYAFNNAKSIYFSLPFFSLLPNHAIIIYHIRGNKMAGQKIIALEGIDGSGKTVQFRLLCEHIRAAGATISTMDFPVYDGFIGQEIGKLLSNTGEVSAKELDPKSMALWFAADRLVNIKKRDLEADYLIINRYTLSNVVYQSIRQENRWELAEWIFKLENEIFGIPKADAYIFFDVDKDFAQSNLSKKGRRDYLGDKKDVYENSTYIQEQARQMYLESAKRYDNIIVIQCMENGVMKSARNISKQVIAELKLKNLL